MAAMRIRQMTRLECTKLLEAGRLGHLACSKDGQPYVVPIYFAYAENHLYSFSMPGKKIDWMRINPLVSVAAEEWTKGRAWRGVVVDGRYEELPDRIGHKVQRERAWSLLSKHVDWWEPGALKPADAAVSGATEHVFFRIGVENISGREATEEA